MTEKLKENNFLVLTSIKNKNKNKNKNILLGRWCIEYGYQIANDDFIDIINPFTHKRTIDESREYIDKLYEILIIELTNSLNTIHNENHSGRYWKIIIGPWLMRYITTLHNRYKHIVLAFNKYPDIETVIMNRESFITPVDTMDFSNRVKKDEYNLQIITHLISLMYKKFPSKSVSQSYDKCYKRSVKRRYKGFILSWVTTKFSKISSFFFRKVIVFRSSGMHRDSEISMLSKFHGRMISIRGLDIGNIEYPLNHANRKLLISNSFDEFTSLLSKTLSLDIPMCFIEGYRNLQDRAKKEYPKNTSCIFSGNAWYGDEVFKLWSAIQSEQETILIGSPHGGGYGAYKNHAYYNHETSILDYYFTWGWNKESKFSKNIPMPASKIIFCKKISFDKKIHGILWGTTTTPRYIIDYAVGNFFFNDYLNWQKRFLCSLSSDLYKEILLRPHREDNGWNIAGRLTEITSKIQIKSWKDGSFLESLCDCRIYVCDHIATTYIESLSHNKPTILFWNPENHIMTDEARYYFNILKDSGILFETPELAAAKVSQIYDNVWEWWNEPNRQKAVKDFLDKFALVVDDPTKQWKDKILLLESN